MPARRYVLALDQGTTGSTALVVDPDGRVLARGYAELPQYFPRPGWVEHDPEEIWTTVERAARAALGEARIAGAEVAAIGITNQRETTILWDRASGAPLHRAIVWQCRRTAPICERLRAEGAEPLVRERTGLVLDAYFSGTKIGWVLDEVPGARSRAERGHVAFGTVDAWLLWKLTGGRVHATDASNASRTLCLSLKTGDWDDEMLKLLGVPRAVLQWRRDGLGLFTHAAASEAMARSVDDTAGVYFVPAFVGLGAPYWDMYARGTIVGLTRGTTGAHLARAALEAIAFQSRDVLEAMAADAGIGVRELRVDGGAAANDFLCQFQADLMDVAVLRPSVIETTALGAAYLAGLGAGLWRSLDDLSRRWTIERTFTPAMDPATRAARCEGWRRAVERARGWADERPQ